MQPDRFQSIFIAYIEICCFAEIAGNDLKRAKNIFTCWESLPEKFNCLKKMAIALLSAFGSTYLCEQIFSHVKFIRSAHRSRLTEDDSKLCAQLKVSKFSPNITELSKVKQGQGSY